MVELGQEIAGFRPMNQETPLTGSRPLSFVKLQGLHFYMRVCLMEHDFKICYVSSDC